MISAASGCGGGVSPQASERLALDHAAVARARNVLQKAIDKRDADEAANMCSMKSLNLAAVKAAEEALKKAEDKRDADEAVLAAASGGGTMLSRNDDAKRLADRVAAALVIAPVKPAVAVTGLRIIA